MGNCNKEGLRNAIRLVLLEHTLSGETDQAFKAQQENNFLFSQCLR